jgi:hypothetical protein
VNNNKRVLFRLIEHYINNINKKHVEKMYGPNSFIKIHTLSESVRTNSLLFEVVVVLGDVITEDVLDKTLAEVLVRNALVHFYPEQIIKTYVRFDS